MKFRRVTIRKVITSPPARRCSAPRSRRYEFDGQEYNGSRMHDVDFNTCTDCHATHTGEVRSDDCAERHDVDRLEDLRTIRADEEDMELVDYDGDGDVEEVCEEMRRSRKRCCGRSRGLCLGQRFGHHLRARIASILFFEQQRQRQAADDEVT